MASGCMTNNNWNQEMSIRNRTPSSTHPRRQLRCAACRAARLPEDACEIFVLQDAGSISRHEHEKIWNFAERPIMTSHCV
jgi:hypothetical protein